MKLFQNKRNQEQAKEIADAIAMENARMRAKIAKRREHWVSRFESAVNYLLPDGLDSGSVLNAAQIVNGAALIADLELKAIEERFPEGIEE